MRGVASARLEPKSVDVRARAAEVSLEVDLNGSAVDIEEWWTLLLSPSRQQEVLFTVKPTEASSLTGFLRLTAQVPQGSESGDWQVRYMFYKSRTGDYVVLDPNAFGISFRVG